MRKVKYATASEGITWTGFSDNFLSVDWDIPKPVKVGMSVEEAEKQAKKRMFWKIKMAEHARQVMFSISKLELEDEL